MAYKIINAISSAKVPKWGNTGDYLAIHYLGVTGENHDLDSDGCGIRMDAVRTITYIRTERSIRDVATMQSCIR